MKTPSRDIYWSYIVGSYLLLKDMSTFEIAMDCHQVRQDLGLPSPTPMSFTNPMAVMHHTRTASTSSASSHRSSSATSLPKSPKENSNGTNGIITTAYSNYGNPTPLTKDSIPLTFVISSEEKLSWLLKRGIYPTDVSLEFVPLMREDKGFIHFMGNIKILQMKSQTSTIGWIFHLLKSLEKFTAHDNKSVDDIFIQGFVNQCKINSARLWDSPPGPHFLESLCINVEKLSVKTLEHMITNLPDIKSILLNDGSTPLFRHQLDLIVKNSPNLTSVEIWNSNVNDPPLECFKKATLKLERVKLFRCPNVTSTGLTNILSTVSNITDFTLENMNITQHSLTAIFSTCPNMLKLTLWNNSNRYSDALLKGVAKYCSKVKKLKIYNDSKSDTYTDDGIRALCSSCLEIEELILSCETLTIVCIEMLVHTYRNTLKKITIPVKGQNSDWIDRLFESSMTRVVKQV